MRPTAYPIASGTAAMSQTSHIGIFRQRAHPRTAIAPPIAPPNHTRPEPEKNASPGCWMT